VSWSTSWHRSGTRGWTFDSPGDVGQPWNPGRVVTITVIRFGTVITGDGQTSLPDTDVVLVDGVIRDFPRSDSDRSLGQADLIVDTTGKVVTPSDL
jgi:hypothetical protein